MTFILISWIRWRLLGFSTVKFLCISLYFISNFKEFCFWDDANPISPQTFAHKLQHLFCFIIFSPLSIWPNCYATSLVRLSYVAHSTSTGVGIRVSGVCLYCTLLPGDWFQIKIFYWCVIIYFNWTSLDLSSVIFKMGSYALKILEANIKNN